MKEILQDYKKEGFTWFEFLMAGGVVLAGIAVMGLACWLFG